jgi:hypothetical protein
MPIEMLITDSIVLSITLNGSPETSPPGPERERIFSALESICDRTKDHLFILNGVAYRVVHGLDGMDSGTQFSRMGEADCEACIVLAPRDAANQYVTLTYTLRGDTLTVDFNQTTALSGNNVFPAILADPETGEALDFPSSDIFAMSQMNGLGFVMLEDLHEQIHQSHGRLFSAPTQQAMDDGNIHLVRVQWAAYLPATDVKEFLQTLAIWYEQTIAWGSGIIRLATYLKLEIQVFTDDETHELAGVLFKKRHGKQLHTSVLLYDKRRRVAQMRQGNTLTPLETEAVRECARLDITAHSIGIEGIVEKARGWFKTLRKKGTARKEPDWLNEFMAGEVKSTVWWLEKAVFILSHRIQEDRAVRGSFAKWLVAHCARCSASRYYFEI